MPLKPTIAIIGAGFSGLATAWHLLNSKTAPSVTLYSDDREASKIAAGLLHKYVGLRANLNPLAREAESKTHQLIEATLNQSSILSKGILRLALTAQQKEDYFKCASQHDDVEWLSPEQCKALNPHFPDAPGIFLHSGMTIDTESYLNKLLLSCEQKGLVVEKKHITDFGQLKEFDIIIAAAGANSIKLPPLDTLKLHAIKGQLLELEWPSNLTPLPFPLVSQVYIAMTKDNKSCIVGATYEHTFTSTDPDPQKAIEELYPRALELYPPLKEAKVINVKAAFRCTRPNRLPFAGHVQDNVYAITGMGSRGLLYHAYFAEQLVNAIIKTSHP